MARAWFGWNLSLLAPLLVLATTSGAAAAPTEPGWRVKTELNVGPGLELQVATFDDQADEEMAIQTFTAPMALAWPSLGFNVGYESPSGLRWGGRFAVQVASVLGGGQSIPGVEYNALGRVTLGPTLGWRLGPSSPWELEVGLGFAAQMHGGGQNGLAPNVVMEPQVGVDALGRLIWRPWHYTPVRFQGGLDLGWAMSAPRDASAFGILVVPEIGVVVGY